MNPFTEKILVFDDVVIIPGLSRVEPNQVDLSTSLTERIKLCIPVVSSPMDMVTEAELAIKLAKLGGLGVIHRNISVEEQVDQVRKVKNVDKVYLTEEYEDPGRIVRLEEAGSGYRLIVEKPRNVLLEEISEISAYLRLISGYPIKPTIDENGRLMVGAAISPFDVQRIEKLSKKADVLVVDVAHAHNENVISSLAKIAPTLESDLIVGNIGTKQAALDIISRVEHVSGLRVGVSSGSICSTGEVTGAAAPTLWAVMQVREALEELGLHGKIPILADGGIRSPSDIAKSLISGASATMLGRLLAGAKESASPIISIGGRNYKLYRGMASSSAVRKRYASDRYSGTVKRIPEGVEALVDYTGSLTEIIERIVNTLQASLGYAGASSIRESWNAKLGVLSESAKKEIKPHDLVL
ncbi:MAG: IMP dehydrogenase [Desulfurococcales archaeon]|nr:IMP dehydrogenase [Desulfurococcales archaeon]